MTTEVTPTPTPTPAPAAPAPTPAPAATDWTSGLADEVKGYVQTKGFKDPGAVLESYRNLEKLVGVPQERVLKLPEKEDAPEWAQIHERLGRPKTADEYKIDVPSAADPEFVKDLKATFHKLGVSSKQAAEIATKLDAHIKGAVESDAQAFQAKVAQEAETLKKEWGAAHEQNTAMAKRAAQAFGLTAEQVDGIEKALGFAGTMKLMHTIGSKMGEDGFVSGGHNPGFGALTPAAAQSRIQALKGDMDFQKRFLAGEIAAKQEFENLHKWAYGS